MSLRQSRKNIVNDAIVKEIFEAIDSLEYGQIQITVHDSKIVQVDKTAKKRFEDIWLIEKGGGI
ncbi:MAG: YezD family protein [Candidatus Omnitrophota bacterium]|nr:YezD family protein [Candidatus Omnitrophota bacterium]